MAELHAPKPNQLGVQEITASIDVLREYIDWTPFFMTWSLAGKYPRILEDDVVGEEAKRVFSDANAMLDKLSHENLLTPKGIMGIFLLIVWGMILLFIKMKADSMRYCTVAICVSKQRKRVS